MKACLKKDQKEDLGLAGEAQKADADLEKAGTEKDHPLAGLLLVALDEEADALAKEA